MLEKRKGHKISKLKIFWDTFIIGDFNYGVIRKAKEVLFCTEVLR
jgi:regulator of replication initiation timing